jgi:cytochrome c556
MPRYALRCLVLTACVSGTLSTYAEDDAAHERHELMEGVGEAAKPVGAMLKGEAPYDAAALQESMATFLEASEDFGQLFPPGSEGGADSRAAPAVWEDRAGFDEALRDWHDAINAAIASNPATLETARPVVGPVFNACKNCHDGYRLEED